MDKCRIPQTEAIGFRTLGDSGPGKDGNQWNIDIIFLPSGIGQERGHNQRFFRINNIAIDADFHPEIQADFLGFFDKSSRRFNRNDDLTCQDSWPQAFGFHTEQTLVPEVAGDVAWRFFDIAIPGHEAQEIPVALGTAELHQDGRTFLEYTGPHNVIDIRHLVFV